MMYLFLFLLMLRADIKIYKNQKIILNMLCLNILQLKSTNVFQY